jgi:Tol biopolymer transport system component
MFTRADFRRRPNFDLYLVRDDGSEMHRVTYDAAFDGLPAFSPDGRYLMWTSRRTGLDAPQIFIAEFVGLTPEGELCAVE